jgi:hypothetical protein
MKKSKINKSMCGCFIGSLLVAGFLSAAYNFQINKKAKPKKTYILLSLSNTLLLTFLTCHRKLYNSLFLNFDKDVVVIGKKSCRAPTQQQHKHLKSTD